MRDPSNEEILKQYGKNLCGFKKEYYDIFPWLEYSIKSDSAYCFICRVIRTNRCIKHDKSTIHKMNNIFN